MPLNLYMFLPDPATSVSGPLDPVLITTWLSPAPGSNRAAPIVAPSMKVLKPEPATKLRDDPGPLSPRLINVPLPVPGRNMSWLIEPVFSSVG